MRITFVVHQFPKHYFTGTEQYVLAVGTELQRRGHDPARLRRDRDAVRPPKSLAAAVDEFEALYARAARG